MPTTNWVFAARVLRVVDADTLDLEIDQGMHARRTERIRLLGVNAAEVRGESKALGAAATAAVRAWLGAAPPAEWPLVVETYKTDVFGRYLARVWRVDTGDELSAYVLGLPGSVLA